MLRWCARHSTLVMLILSVPASAFYLWLVSSLNLSLWLAVMFITSLAFLARYLVSYCGRFLLVKAQGALNNACDPYPLLEESEDQLSYNRSKVYGQILTINRAEALTAMGRYDEARSALESIDIDQYSSTLPTTRMSYFYSLCMLYLFLKDIPKAEALQIKLSEQSGKIIGKKEKALFNKNAQIISAEMAAAKKKYNKAIEIINENPPENKAHAIGSAMLLARIYIGLKKRDMAAAQLEFVIENGNKLFSVQAAGALLAGL